MKSSFRIALVGDIHDQWDRGDHTALDHLGVDLVLFVGDIGNEAVPIVALIATLDLPKAVILGNHDAWYTASEWGRKKSPYGATPDRVEAQLALLGDCHVGYSYRDFPHLALSVVGGRPFSWGGADWKNQEFYQQRYGVTCFDTSVERICAAGQKARYSTLIFLAHNGPLGLGSLPSDPCGKDWKPGGGDHGDPDLRAAIDILRSQGKHIPLVAFGHMHHRLKGESRLRTPLTQTPQGEIYLNTACVPRWITESGKTKRNFTVVSFVDQRIESVTLVWLWEDGQVSETRSLWHRSGGSKL